MALDAKKVLAILDGAKADLVNGKVPSDQLPSYVDDVVEYENQSAFPATGEAGKIYVALDTNKTYRWSGTTYIEVGSGLEIFYATYGTTTYAEIVAANTAGKIIYCDYAGAMTLPLVGLTSSLAAFGTVVKESTAISVATAQVTSANVWSNDSDNVTDKIYEATYNSTTFSEIKAQHIDGKVVYCSYGGTVYFITSITNTYVNFETIYTESSGVVNLNKIYVDADGWNAPTATVIEKSSNKVSSWSGTLSDTNYPSEKLVKDSLDDKITAPSGGETGNVLKKTASGVEWGEASTVQVFNAVYGTTTYAEIAAANTAGKIIYCIYESAYKLQFVGITSSVACFSTIAGGAGADGTGAITVNVTSANVWSADMDFVILHPDGGSTGQFLQKGSSGTEVSWASVSVPTITTTTFTLTAAGWSSSSQTVSVTGVTASNIVVVSPAPSSCIEYDTDKILFTAQASGSVTFTCTTTPTVDIVMNAMIIEA